MPLRAPFGASRRRSFADRQRTSRTRFPLRPQRGRSPAAGSRNRSAPRRADQERPTTERPDRSMAPADRSTKRRSGNITIRGFHGLTKAPRTLSEYVVAPAPVAARMAPRAHTHAAAHSARSGVVRRRTSATHPTAASALSRRRRRTWPGRPIRAPGTKGREGKTPPGLDGSTRCDRRRPVAGATREPASYADRSGPGRRVDRDVGPTPPGGAPG